MITVNDDFHETKPAPINIRLDLSGGVTRDPFNPYAQGDPRKKDRFAYNFDDLRFKVDGREIQSRFVWGAFPPVNTLIVMKTDHQGNIINKDNEVELDSITGKVEIIGQPKSINDSLSPYQVDGWFNLQLTESVQDNS